MYFRFINDAPQDYIRWRERGGYVPRNLDFLLEKHGVRRNYEAEFHGEVPQGVTFHQLFTKYWPVERARFEGQGRPVAIAADPAGQCIAIGVVKSADSSERPELTGAMAHRFWNGLNGASMRSWWTPPSDLQAICKRDGRATVAEVGVILQFANGSRRPFVMTFARDNAIPGWTLQFVNQYNTPLDGRVSALEY